MLCLLLLSLCGYAYPASTGSDLQLGSPESAAAPAASAPGASAPGAGLTGAPVARVELLEGRATLAGDGGVRELRAGQRDTLVEGPGYLELRARSRAALRWNATASLIVHGPASFEWAPVEGPGPLLEWRFERLDEVHLEVRRGPVRLSFEGGWTASLESGAGFIGGMPGGGVEWHHDAGLPILLQGPHERHEVRPPWVVLAGAWLRLSPDRAHPELLHGSKERLLDPYARSGSGPTVAGGAPAWSAFGWPWDQGPYGRLSLPSGSGGTPPGEPHPEAGTGKGSGAQSLPTHGRAPATPADAAPEVRRPAPELAAPDGGPSPDAGPSPAGGPLPGELDLPQVPAGAPGALELPKPRQVNPAGPGSGSPEAPLEIQPDPGELSLASRDVQRSELGELEPTPGTPEGEPARADAQRLRLEPVPAQPIDPTPEPVVPPVGGGLALPRVELVPVEAPGQGDGAVPRRSWRPVTTGGVLRLTPWGVRRYEAPSRP